MERLKRELKSWESQFELLHGRRPTKDDLANAPEDIRASYKRYHEFKQHMKAEVQDQSAVFGRNLNKMKEAITPPQTSVVLPKVRFGAHLLQFSPEQLQQESHHTKTVSGKVGETVLGDESLETTCSVTVNTLGAAPFLSPLRIHSKANGVHSSRLKKKKFVSLAWLDKVKCDPPTDVSGPAPPTAVQHQTEHNIVVKQNETEELNCRKELSKIMENSDVENLPIDSNSLNSSCQDSSPSEEHHVTRTVHNYSQRSSDSNATNSDERSWESQVDPGSNHEHLAMMSRKKRKMNESSDDDDVKKMPRLTEEERIEGENKNTGNVPQSRGGSGLVSSNFRRLDMKHRHYKRRGAGMSGSSHKRQQWRKIMKSREAGGCLSDRWGGISGSSGNRKSDVCYKCGEEGHWAKNCRRQFRTKAKSRLDTEGTSEFEDENLGEFPTIDEAALMAVGIPLGQKSEVVEMYHSGQLVLPHELPRAGYLPTAPPDPVEPLHQAVQGQAIATPGDVMSALKKLGFSSFRAGQEEAVMRILCGLSTLVVWSTGAGKSLCYQLPAYLYAKRSSCLTLVISPLVSLMEDQVSGLPFGLKGACLHTNMTKVQREKVTRDLCAGKLAVLLLSPEALVAGKGYLPAAAQLPPVAFACIDEAHCISEWSHNFRPSYLRVCKVLRERYGVRCFLGLTATATLSTAASAAQHLGIAPDDHSAIVRGVTVPSNLKLSVSVDADRDKALVDLFRDEPFSRCYSVIIYCTRREETERVASMLRICLQNVPRALIKETSEGAETSKKKQKKGRTKRKAGELPPAWEVESYHAGMTAAQRRRVQRQFMSGEVHVVVATVAFGMGLDKSDVRAIIHYNMPKTFEGYVQEIGRAGRDGLLAHCHVFLDPEGRDICELRRHVHANTVDRFTVKKLVNQFFPHCKCQELTKTQEERKECNMAVTALLEDNLDIDITDGDSTSAGSAEENDATVSAPQPDHPESYPHVCSDENGRALESASELRLVATDAPTSSAKCSTARVSNQSAGVSEKEGGRYCGGHDIALIIEDLVNDLDMSEENILTLLCYLELHPNRLLQVLEPVKSTCTLKFYGGIAQMKKVAQKVPAVAAAAATISSNSSYEKKSSNTLTFSAVKVADRMGWDLDPLSKELRALQWNTSLAALGAGEASLGQSGILVEFSDLSLHVRAPGDFSPEQRDQVCDFLEERIIMEEQSQLRKLSTIYSVLKHFASSERQSVLELKGVIRSYFQDSSERFRSLVQELGSGLDVAAATVLQNKLVNWENVSRDIRTFVGIHREHSFTGRNVARIFHGIDSPCFPASVWGRERRFWRKHLDVDFNALRKFATQELLKLR